MDTIVIVETITKIEVKIVPVGIIFLVDPLGQIEIVRQFRIVVVISEVEIPSRFYCPFGCPLACCCLS